MSEENHEEFVYTDEDLVPKRKKVTLGSKGKFVLISASSTVVAQYQSAIRKGMRVGKNAETVEFSESVNEADAVLVAGCLCRTPPNNPEVESRDVSGNPVVVGLPFVRALPYKLQDDFYKWVKANTPGMEDPPADVTPQQRAAAEEEAVGNS